MFFLVFFVFLKILRYLIYILGRKESLWNRLHAQRCVQNVNAQYNKCYKTNIHAATSRTRSCQSIADIPQRLTFPLRPEGPVLGLFLKFGINRLQGFSNLTFSFLSVVHPLKVYEVIAHNIHVHWISAAFKYLGVSSKITMTKKMVTHALKILAYSFPKHQVCGTQLQPEHWGMYSQVSLPKGLVP